MAQHIDKDIVVTKINAFKKLVLKHRKENKVMNTQIGRQYKCVKDYKQGNCSYTKGKTYHCSRDGYLNDDHDVSWSCSEEWFNKYLRIHKGE